MALVALGIVSGLLITGQFADRTLTGVVTIVESPTVRFERDVRGGLADGSGFPLSGSLERCLAIAKTFGVAPGSAVQVYDQAGIVLGNGRLGQGEAVADGAMNGALCRLPFVVDRIGDSQALTVEIGAHQRVTYPSRELDARAWHVELRLGS